MAKKKTPAKEKKATTKKVEAKKPVAKKTVTKEAEVKKVVVKKAEPVISEERYNQLNRVVVGRPLTTVEIISLFEREIGGEVKTEKPNVFQVAIVVKGVRFPKEGHYTCKS